MSARVGSSMLVACVTVISLPPSAGPAEGRKDVTVRSGATAQKPKLWLASCANCWPLSEIRSTCALVGSGVCVAGSVQCSSPVAASKRPSLVAPSLAHCGPLLR